MNYQLICLDLDGTLLDDQKKILPRARESVKQAAEQGNQDRTGLRKNAGGSGSDRRGTWNFVYQSVQRGYLHFKGRSVHQQRVSSCGYHEPIILRDRGALSDAALIFRHNRWFVTGSDRYVEKEGEIIHHRPEFADVEELAAEWAKEGTGPNKLVLAASPDEITEIYNVIAAPETEPILTWHGRRIHFLRFFRRGSTKGNRIKSSLSEPGCKTGKCDRIRRS